MSLPELEKEYKERLAAVGLREAGFTVCQDGFGKWLVEQFGSTGFRVWKSPHRHWYRKDAEDEMASARYDWEQGRKADERRYYPIEVCE